MTIEKRGDMNRLLSWFNILIKKRMKLKRWQRIVTVLAAMITFVTTYALILPAITVEKDRAEEVGGMYLEQEEAQDDLLEENALEFTGVSIAADQENAVTYEYADDDMMAVATFSTDEEIPEGAELVVNPVDTKSEEYADLSSRAALLLDREFIYDVTTCSFFDYALICDGDDVTPKSGLVDVQINFMNNSVEHIDDVVYAGRFGRPADVTEGFAAMSADYSAETADANVETAVAADDDLTDSVDLSNVNDELVSANPDESSVIDLTDGVISVISLKGNDLALTDSVVGILAGNVDEEAKAAAAETDAAIPDNGDLEEETAAPGIKTLKAIGTDYTVSLSYDEVSGIPEGATLTASEIAQDSKEYQTYLEEAKKAMGLSEEETLPHCAARFFDIKIMAGDKEFTPETGVSVEITYAEPIAENPETEVSAVHFSDDTSEAEVIKANTSEVQADGAATVEFTAESFSVYGVVYTVDFHWDVNGKTYDFSLPGGGFVSLQQLIEALCVVGNSDSEDFIADVKKVEFSSPDLIWVEKVAADTTVGALKEMNKLEVQYSGDLTDEQIEAINAQPVKANDWAIISLSPFVSEEVLTITMKDGERFVIRVTDAQSDAVMKSDNTYVDTISNPAGTTIDLFDYWIDDNRRYNSKQSGWPDGLPGFGWRGNNSGINSSPDDSAHGHALKFNPAYGGTVRDGTLDNWNRTAENGGSGLNSWTTNAIPRQGIVTPQLVDGYPKLSGNGNLGCTNESLSYLFDNSSQAGKETYFGVNHLLYVDKEGFYKFDSNDFNAHYNESSREFELTKQDLNVDPGPKRGFWPFDSDGREQVFWHGMHMNTQFSMPQDGKVLSPTGKYNDMIFEFQGDDDTWVYVDGILVGDGGGVHNQTFIQINFQNGTVTVDAKHDIKDDYRRDWEQTLYLQDLYVDAEKYNQDDWVQVKDANGDPVYRTDAGHENQPLMTFKPGTYHKFDMFYLERGGGESNLHIRYNLISTADFTAHKSYHSEENHRLLRDQFQFELIGLDGQYRGAQGERELVDASKPAIMPKGGSENGDGTVANPTKIHDDANNRTIYTVGVSEDGNVNFGDADISSEEMRNCDIGSPSTYRYMVREIVPPDAVNADGKTWAESNEEEKAEGGYHKVDDNGEDITYDGKVFYFEGTVRRSTLPGGGYKYDLKKTRYTDATFTTEDTETKFFSFVNGHIDPLALKVNKKSDTNKALSGAEFKLTRAKLIDGKWTERTGSSVQTTTSNAQGELTFANPRLTEGHYLLEETAAPAGYMQSDNMWLVTVSKQDSATGIVLQPTITLLSSDGTPIGEPEPLNVDNTTFTFEKAIVNTPMPKGDITVVKKWLKPNGEEYTQEEMSKLDLSGTVITGELWRRGLGIVQTQVKNPTVTIYGKKREQNYSGKGDVLLDPTSVEPGSSIRFWTYRDNANNPNDISVVANNDSTVTPIGRPQDGDYNTVPPWRYVYEVSNIEQDTEITVTMGGSNTLRYGTVSAQVTGEYSTQQGTGETTTKVKDFELSGGVWSMTWTREQLDEGSDDNFTYYLKNVAEQNSNGFTFLKDETGILDPLTGTITFIQKNTNEKTKVKVKKEWTPMPDNPADASAKVTLHRYRMLTKGLLEVTLVSDQGAAIEGATFDLYKDGDVIGTYTTDVNGRITLKDLPEGEYYLLQTDTPSPYRIEGTVQTEPWSVSGDTFEKQEHKETLVNFTNEPAGLFTIELQNPEGDGLENGIFDLYRQGENDPIITGISTGTDGKWTTDRLGAGTYYFVQTGAPEGYVLPENRTTESFSVDDPEQVKEKTVTMVNLHKAKGSVLVHLNKAAGNSPIAGAVFELYRNNILFRSGTTDANGQVLFSDLPSGDYEVKQKSSASGMNIAESGEGSQFTIDENGTTDQNKEAYFTNTESAGNVTLNVYSARSNSQYNAYFVKTFTQLKANTTYHIRIGVPESNVKNGDQVSYCKTYEPDKVPQGEMPIDNSEWAYGEPAYALDNNGQNVRMMYRDFEFKAETDDTVYNIAIDSMKGWGLYPVTADTPQAVTLSAGRNPLRVFSSMLRGAKANAPKSGGSAGDVQPVVPTGYKNDTDFEPVEYTIKSKDNWEHTFENLDKYDENGNPYIYYVIEGERTPQGYSVASYTTNDDGSEITVNNITSIELTLKKIDQDDMDTVKTEGSLDNVSLLNGAKFKLVKYSSITPTTNEDTSWNENHSNETSGVDGTFSFTDVVPGIYEIVETAYPKGYIRAADTPYIQVTSDLTVQFISKNGNVLDTAESYFVLDDTTIVVGNTHGAALPNTGGMGTRMIYLLGGILILGSGLLLMRRRTI